MTDTTPLRIVIRDNVVRLMRASGPKERRLLSRLAPMAGGQGNAQSILNADRDVGLKILQQVAEAHSVEVWQLLFPGLDPDNLPRAEPYAFRWPFRQVSPEALLSLTGTAAQGIENGLLASLATLGLQPKASSVLDRAIGAPQAERPPGRRAITAEAPAAATAPAAQPAARKRTAKAPTGS